MKRFFEVYSYRGFLRSGTITHKITETIADAQKFMDGNPEYHLDEWQISNGHAVLIRNIL
jgi:hypothetical protein